MIIVTRLLCAAVFALLASDQAASQAKNVLLYGNSFSFYNGGVGPGLRRVAEAAGHPTPNVYERLSSGQTMSYHATNPSQVAAISNSLLPGQEWDAVVMQGQSLEATATLGNPLQFRNRALTIATNVRNHSPGAIAVLYQTWARAQGHFFYPGTYPAPLAMQAEINAGYQLAADAINASMGSGAAEVARVGDGVALLEFEQSYYAADLFHPGPATTVLASMCLFTAIYGERACDIQADLSAGGPLIAWLSNIGLAAADWRAMAAIADRCARPELRPFPGSSDQLMLESGSPPGPTDACPQVGISAGDYLVLQLSSRNGVYDQAPALIIGTAFLNGAPPSPTASLPELHVDPTNMFVLLANPSPPATIFTVVPTSFVGLSVMIQGVSFAPSATTGNQSLTATDGHVIQFQ
jgi:hypothetical protein